MPTAKLKPKKTIKKKRRKADSNHIIISEAPKGAHWYVVHTYSGHESTTATTLKQRTHTLGLDHKIFEILVPTQEKIKVSKGKKSIIREKIFPGYILVKMIISDDSWLAVRSTTGVTGFVGASNNPTPLPQSEVKSIMAFSLQSAPKFQSTFSIGEAVRVSEGPFSDMLGTINKINEDKGKLEVLVSIFGRETPVELDFLQVTKA